MSPAKSRPRARSKKKAAPLPAWLLLLLPLLAGILVTPFAMRAASVLALSGPSALRLLYPYVLLVQSHSQGFTGSQDDTLAQWTMYGQFPAYGLLWMLCRRLIRGTAGPLSAILAHCGGIAAAILSARGAGS